MKIPEIDFSSYDENDGRALAALADALNEALAGVGFLSLRNIGIPTGFEPVLRSR